MAESEVINEAEINKCEKNEGCTGHDDELPEGWVRKGKGLRLDVPMSPSLKCQYVPKNTLCLDFTYDNKKTDSLQSTLMKLDRDVVHDIKSRTISFKAAKPTTRCKNKNNAFVCRIKPASLHSLSNNKLAYSSNSALDGVGVLFDNRKMSEMRDHYEREIQKTRQNVLAYVEDLIKKYRQLAIDAVEAARNERRKFQDERKSIYNIAYDACTKYETDLKSTVKNAIVELQTSAEAAYKAITSERDQLKQRCESLESSRSNDNLNDKINSLTCKLKVNDLTNHVLMDFNRFRNGIVEGLSDMISGEVNRKDVNELVSSIILRELMDNRVL